MTTNPLPGNKAAAALQTTILNLEGRHITSEDLAVVIAQTNALMAVAEELRTLTLAMVASTTVQQDVADQLGEEVERRLGLRFSTADPQEES